MVTERDYYDILGVPRGASDAEIKRAFRKLAQKWHPDVSTDPGADERFKEINEAYQVLSDPQRRQSYDTFGRAGVGMGAEGFGPFGGFAEAIGGTEKEIEFDLRDRCSTCGGSGAAPGSEAVTCPQCGGRGEVRTVRTTMLGQMVNVSPCPRCRGEGRTVDKPCADCRGEGRRERHKKLRVSVPAGIDEGHQIRLSGEGEAGPRGGPPGSLYVAVHVTPHPQLRREGTELYHGLDLSIAQAALGTRLTVPTADGEEEIEIRPGTQPGTEIRLRGRGVPHLRRAGVRGDLHVIVDVRVPTKLSKRQRELLEAYAAEEGTRVSGNGSGGILGRVGERVKDALG